MKPDLVIHPLYANILLHQYKLDAFYNVILLDDLKISTDDGEEGAALMVGNKTCHSVSVTLTPFYDNARNCESGIRPHLTSYFFAKSMPLYRIAQRAPRYVIWTRTDPLTICATYVDRVAFGDLYGAVCRARQWSYDIRTVASIIVFDLDRTLINDRDELLVGALDALTYARQSYDYVVLWSHGSPLHVDESVSMLQRSLHERGHQSSIFDLVLCNEFEAERSNKNLLYLYNFFTDCTFGRAILVDDSVYNWTPEYDRIILPLADTLVPALPYI